MTAVIVWTCKGRSKKGRFSEKGHEANSHINPALVRHPSDHYPTGMHEYESVHSDYEQLQHITHSAGNTQTLEQETPLEEYYETPQVGTPSTEPAPYYI